MKAPEAPSAQASNAPPSPAPSLISSGEVLHSESHSHLTPEEIAKAVARHKREHREPASGKKQ